jgi:hypothetical protein
LDVFCIVKAGVGVGVTVGVGDKHITLNTVWFENTADGLSAPVPAIPPTFVKLSLQALVVAHHVYEPLWSLMLPRAQLTIGFVVAGGPGFAPEYVSPAGTVSYNVVFADTLSLNNIKLLYESCVLPSLSSPCSPTPGLQSELVPPWSGHSKLAFVSSAVSV